MILTLEDAILGLVNQLSPTPTTPQSKATPKQVERNAEIKALYNYGKGLDVPTLAVKYGISTKQIYQILRGKRK